MGLRPGDGRLRQGDIEGDSQAAGNCQEQTSMDATCVPGTTKDS